MQVLAQDIKLNSRNEENKRESECWQSVGRSEQSTIKPDNNHNPCGDIEVLLEVSERSESC